MYIMDIYIMDIFAICKPDIPVSPARDERVRGERTVVS